MNTQEKRSLQSFRRELGWLSAHPGVGGAQEAELNTIVNEMTVTASAQEGFDRAADGAAADIVRLRDELVKQQMRHIAIAAESAIPDVVRMTVALRRPGYRDAEGLILSADAMADAAAQPKYKDLLVQQGLPADFIEQLRATTAEFKRAIDTRGASVGQRHYAGEAMYDLVQRGKRVVGLLSAMVAKRYRGDAATLAEWKQVKHIVPVGARGARVSAADDAPVQVQQPAVQVQQPAVQVQQTSVQLQQPAVHVQQAAAA